MMACRVNLWVPFCIKWDIISATATVLCWRAKVICLLHNQLDWAVFSMWQSDPCYVKSMAVPVDHLQMCPAIHIFRVIMFNYSHLELTGFEWFVKNPFQHTQIQCWLQIGTKIFSILILHQKSCTNKVIISLNSLLFNIIWLMLIILTSVCIIK